MVRAFPIPNDRKIPWTAEMNRGAAVGAVPSQMASRVATSSVKIGLLIN
jgi:hypothetical protein